MLVSTSVDGGKHAKFSDVKKATVTLHERFATGVASTVSAIAALEKIVEKNPLDGESILILADYYGRNEKIEEAELFYQRAEQIAEFEIRAKISHAQFHVQRNNFNKAVPLLKEAQSKRPRDNVQRYLDQVERLAKLKTR